MCQELCYYIQQVLILKFAFGPKKVYRTFRETGPRFFFLNWRLKGMCHYFLAHFAIIANHTTLFGVELIVIDEITDKL